MEGNDGRYLGAGPEINQEPSPKISPEKQNRLTKAKDLIARVDHVLNSTGLTGLYGFKVEDQNGDLWLVERSTEDLEDILLITSDDEEENLDQDPELSFHLSIDHSASPEFAIYTEYEDKTKFIEHETDDAVVEAIGGIFDDLGFPTIKEVRAQDASQES